MKQTRRKRRSPYGIHDLEPGERCPRCGRIYQAPNWLPPRHASFAISRAVVHRGEYVPLSERISDRRADRCRTCGRPPSLAA
ncbi:MAG TPA: hypothetical protein VNM91_07990 [Dehalococcoidia bacterium]|nr:hypothetical protein [Dehalococcoidia bacterium]